MDIIDDNNDDENDDGENSGAEKDNGESDNGENVGGENHDGEKFSLRIVVVRVMMVRIVVIICCSHLLWLILAHTSKPPHSDHCRRRIMMVMVLVMGFHFKDIQICFFVTMMTAMILKRMSTS